jgi:hypothetical protein
MGRLAGRTHHPIVAFPGKNEDCAPGTMFEISDAELAHADAYEVAAYVRVKAPLGRREPGAVRAAFLVELRGFEPQCSWQCPRLTALRAGRSVRQQLDSETFVVPER